MAERTQKQPSVAMETRTVVYDLDGRIADPSGWALRLSRTIRRELTAGSRHGRAFEVLLAAFETDSEPTEPHSDTKEASMRSHDEVDLHWAARALTPGFRTSLYGPMGRWTGPRWMLAGLAIQFAKVRRQLPDIAPEAVLAEAIGAYGDILSLHFPQGQTAWSAVVAEHEPFEDAPAASQPDTASQNQTPARPTPPEQQPTRRPSRTDIDARVAADRERLRRQVQAHMQRAHQTVRQEWGAVGGAGAVLAGLVTAVVVACRGGRR